MFFIHNGEYFQTTELKHTMNKHILPVEHTIVT